MSPDDTAMSSVQRRRRRAHELIFHNEFRGLPLEECWAKVCPDSDVSPRKARELAKAEIEWSRRNYPIPMKVQLALRRMDVNTLLEGLMSQAAAVLPTTVTVRESGKVIKRYCEKPVSAEAATPDSRARLDALDQLLTLREAAYSDDPPR